jgi:hypothetical protein
MGGRSRSNSTVSQSSPFLSSENTPESMTPSDIKLEPSTMMLSRSAPTPSGGMVHSVLLPPRNQQQQHQTTFRAMSTPTSGVASPVLVPQTGLGILLDGRTFAPVGTTINARALSPDPTIQNNKANANNGNSGGAAGFKINHRPGMAHSTLELRKRMQQDLVDRERQASSLAAAGMVAETVSRSRSYGSLDYHNHSNPGSAMSSPLRHVSSSQGPLASQPELGPLTSTLSPGGTPMTNIIHGNTQMDGGI